MGKQLNLNNGINFIDAHKYDYDKIESIIAALNYLRIEAKNTSSDEIEALITGAFNSCFIIHELLIKLKYANNSNLPSSRMVGD